MSLNILVKRTQRYLSNNAPLVLTSVGVTGLVTTAYLSGKSGFKAGQIIAEERQRAYNSGSFTDRYEFEEAFNARYILEATWKLYIPALIVGSATITAIIASNRIGTKRAAALAAAYTLSERAYSEYKERIVQTIGAKKEQAVRDELAQERVLQNPESNRQVIVSSGDVLCYDTFSGRYFMSSMESLKGAQNATNYEILNNVYASLSDYYGHVGLPKTDLSDEVGWTSDKLLELDFSTVMSEDGKPCISVSFMVKPVRDYYKAF